MEKKEWIEEVLKSTKNLQRAEAPTSLWEKINERLTAKTNVIALVPTRTVWLAAASLGLLAVLNWFAVRTYQNRPADTSSVELLIDQYQLK